MLNYIPEADAFLLIVAIGQPGSMCPGGGCQNIRGTGSARLNAAHAKGTGELDDNYRMYAIRGADLRDGVVAPPRPSLLPPRAPTYR
jgi:hypothetical protein